MRSQSLKPPTLEDHKRSRARIIALAWMLWRNQYEKQFVVQHPLPEEHLRIEIRLFWEGQIQEIHGWTDPVGQLIQPIRDVVNNILSWFWKNVFRPGIQALLATGEFLLNKIKSGVEGLSRTLGSVQTAILNAVAGVIRTVTSSLQAVQKALGQAIQGVAQTVTTTINSVLTQLQESTSWLFKQVQGLFSTVGEVLKQIGVWLINAIKTYVLDPLMTGIQELFKGAQQLVTGLITYMTGGVKLGSPAEWRGSYMRWLGIVSGASAMAFVPLIASKLIDIVHPMKDLKTGEIVKAAIDFSGFAFLQAAFFTTYFDIATAKPVRQELNAIFRPELPSIDEATRMLWRGKISREDLQELIALKGYADIWRDGYMELTQQIPGPGDLVRFVVREVINPKDFINYMGKQGYSPFWADAFWEAHWVLPPPERTRTAFLRGGLTEDEYRKFLVWYDFKPDPRPGISKSDVDIMLETQYDWPGRIDMRWMTEWNVITPEDLTNLLKADGMDPAWAPRVSEAWILNQLREELGKVRRVYEEKLKAGFLDREGFAESLTRLHYAPHVINALAMWAEEQLDLEEKLELADEYKSLAKEGLITVEEYGNLLRELGMTETMITRRMNHIRLLLAIKEVRAAKKAG